MTPHISAGDLAVLAVNAAPCGILAVDATGSIVLANPEIERIFGYRAEGLIGQVMDKLIPDRFRTSHAAHQAGYAAAAGVEPPGCRP